MLCDVLFVGGCCCVVDVLVLLLWSFLFVVGLCVLLLCIVVLCVVCVVCLVLFWCLVHVDVW